jgi:DNA mismatch repair protein MutL
MTERNKIIILSDRTINIIAAGEVVERPASVVKELVENSIDANASEITISIENGGKSLIKVDDNGFGIAKDDILLAIERHATSKLDEDDINSIKKFGFRGEALPSIGAVSSLKITTRTRDEEHAWQVTIEGDKKSDLQPASRTVGTTVKVSNLFGFTPTRLKFLKSDLAEKNVIIDIIRRFALGNRNISFKLISDEKVIFNVLNNKLESTDNRDENNERSRISSIIGSDFSENSVSINTGLPDIKISGFIGIPTYNHYSNYHQYFFINSRFLKDKLLFSAIKASYYNLIPSNRHAAVILFIEINPYEVDVNVHPGKTEVRFREPDKIRSLIVNTIKKTLRQSNSLSSTTSAQQVVNILQKQNPINRYERNDTSQPPNLLMKDFYHLQNKYKTYEPYKTSSNEPSVEQIKESYAEIGSEDKAIPDLEDHTTADTGFLGYARFQIANTYIVAENTNGMILVDQHAAHERIVLEKIKQYKDFGKLQTQVLLIPEIVKLGQHLTNKILEFKDRIDDLGFQIERNGLTEVLVRKIPDIFGCDSISVLIKELAEYLNEHNDVDIIEKKIEEIYSNIACRSSMRAGKILNIVEMNNLLRMIEKTPLSSQCNHGRPTFVKLEEKDLAKIFHR